MNSLTPAFGLLHNGRCLGRHNSLCAPLLVKCEQDFVESRSCRKARIRWRFPVRVACETPGISSFYCGSTKRMYHVRDFAKVSADFFPNPSSNNIVTILHVISWQIEVYEVSHQPSHRAIFFIEKRIGIHTGSMRPRNTSLGQKNCPISRFAFRAYSATVRSASDRSNSITTENNVLRNNPVTTLPKDHGAVRIRWRTITWRQDTVAAMGSPAFLDGVDGRNSERASTMSNFGVLRAVSDPRFGKPTNKAEIDQPLEQIVSYSGLKTASLSSRPGRCLTLLGRRNLDH